MPRNIEIKARIEDPAGTEALVRSLADSGPELLTQEDVFFQVPRGRLKLRLLDRGGELIAYDALSRWVDAGRGEEMPAEAFLDLFRVPLDPATRQGAGLEYAVRSAPGEVAMRVSGCAWARYYQEHHPRVGYMLACSMDEASYRQANPRIRMQRTTTLMEGGSHCDFRIYALPEEGSVK